MKKFNLLCLGLLCAGSMTACAAPTKQMAATTATPEATPNQCPLVTGFYVGHYIDTTGLFPSTNFPINLYLKYQNGMVYGYTLAANDSQGPNYGKKPYALIWGKCQNNEIDNLYIVKNTKIPCGDPATTPSPLKPNTALTLHLNYENAMINADLTATLSPSTSMIAQIVDHPLLNAAIKLGQTGVQTCH